MSGLPPLPAISPTPNTPAAATSHHPTDRRRLHGLAEAVRLPTHAAAAPATMPSHSLSAAGTAAVPSRAGSGAAGIIKKDATTPTRSQAQQM
ncbi:hypothetical protein GCM10009838_48030 [Catenulispora subtropica]|uniref:Uncharacterized protein n=1 Tax=Catenulispora subtropica TaxID=450798 RepID=A0ABN2S6W4_9ACTN